MSRARGGRSLTTVPPITIWPAVMSSSPATMRNSVLLPHPEGPTNTTNSPELISRSIPWMTSLLPYALTTLRSVTSAMIARDRRIRSGRAGLREPGVDDEVLSCDGTRLVGREKQQRSRHVIFGQTKLEALAVDDRLLGLGIEPELPLPFSHCGAGNDGVDADVLRPQLACERAREAVDRSLGRRVRDHAGCRAHPRHRAHVDDRPTPLFLHRGHDGLHGKKVVTKVDGEALVPVFGRNVFDLVPVVARCVVDEHVDRTELGCDGSKRRTQRRDIAQIAAVITDGRGCEPRDKRDRGFVGDVAESDPAALPGKTRDDRRADTGPAARHEHGLAGEAGVRHREGFWDHAPPS